MTTPHHELASGEQIVRDWLGTQTCYYPTKAPESVLEAHLAIEARTPGAAPNIGQCDDECCLICTVFCEICGVHYDREETCQQH
jgi:hypothetical protein